MGTLRRNCPHCPAEHVAFDVHWADVVPNANIRMLNCSAVCGACSKPICFVAIPTSSNNNTSPKAHSGDIELHWTIREVWPKVASPSAPPFTPDSVKKRFLEGEDAFKRNNWNSAVAMYRSALDIATKGMPGVPVNKNFFERLEWLHQNHMITPDIRSWADHVRVEGNAALHDPEDFDGEDAKPLRFFTEMFLRYVFELPGAVNSFRESANNATP
jgi:hypothetical protein